MINISELLKDCPRGMELDSTLFEGLEFDDIIDNDYLPIRCRIKNPNGGYTVYNFTKYGCWVNTTFAKCVIFPKGKTTWEGFTPPCQFKDGDIVFYDDTVAIFKEWGDETLCRNYVIKYLDKDFSILIDMPLFGKSIRREIRFATEEEKAKLFQAIKDNGYKWNAETKTLEELLKFKDGDILTTNLGSVFILKEPNENVLCYSCYVALNDVSRFITSYTKFCIKNGCRLATEEEKQKLFDAIKANGYRWDEETKTLEKLVEPKFKDGSFQHVEIIDEDDELALDKFDITTLKPFESRVLVRDNNCDEWEADIFGRYSNGYITLGGIKWKQCIPFEGNEHLLGTTDDCDEFFKF